MKNPGRCRFTHQLAILQLQNARKPPAEAFIMSCDQDRFAPGHQGFKDLEDLLSRHRIQAAGWLIGDQDRGIIGQRPGDGCPLLLAAGDSGRAV